MSEFRNYKGKTIKIILLSCIIMVGEALSPIIFQSVFNCMESGNKKFFLLIVILLVINIIKWVVQAVTNYLITYISKSISYNYKKKIINNIVNFNGREINEINSGEILATFEEDLYYIEEKIINTFFNSIIEIITSIIMFIVLAYMSTFMAVVSISTQIIIFIIQKMYNNKIIIKKKEIRAIHSESLSLENELTSNLLNIILQKISVKISDKIIKKENELINKCIESIIISQKNSITINIIGLINTLILLVYGFIGIKNGIITIGTLIAFNAYSQRLIIPLINISSNYRIIMQGEIHFKNIYYFIDKTSKKKSNKKVNLKCNKITFKEITFSYDKKVNVLNSVNYTLNKGNIYYIQGESGKGKTTLIKLLMKLYDDYEGEILIDENNIKEIDREYILDFIKYLPQDPYLFNGTIYENVFENESLDNNYIKNMFDDMRITDFSEENILKKEINNIDTRISKGQKQRLSLIKLLLSDSPILILDEPTSALDKLSEKGVMNCIKKHSENKICIIITHKNIEGCENVINI
ncbi:MAG: ATP-binding cassette domain-containing protein [Clostridium sp.]